MSRPRIAAVAYLNALPLIYGLSRGRHRGFCELSLAPPSECARLLQEGLADVALIPSVEFARAAGLAAVPGMGISARREVRSVLLISQVEPSGIRTLAADHSSRTSVALARIVLARRHGCRPRIEPMPPSLPGMLLRHDAALLIGDAALRASLPEARTPRTGFVLDLASEWHGLTRLPFVFAFWACRPVIPVRDVASVLDDSLEEGLANIGRIASEEAERVGLPSDLLRSYLTESIHYTLGGEETDSLRVFYRICGEEGLLATGWRATLEAADPSQSGRTGGPAPPGPGAQHLTVPGKAASPAAPRS